MLVALPLCLSSEEKAQHNEPPIKLPTASDKAPQAVSEALARRLSLPIPKRRGPPSTGEQMHMHQAVEGIDGQCLGVPVHAHQPFCVLSPSYSSDASTVDECEEAPPLGATSCSQSAASRCAADVVSLYSLGPIIGAGSQSFVYKCRWAEGAPAPSGGPLCIKHIVGDACKEALAAACQLSHANIARHFSTFEDWRGLWVLMEFVRGPDLAAYLQRHGQLDELACRRVFRQLVCALECIHAHGLVHQDVKLENLVARIGGEHNGDFHERDVKRPVCAAEAEAPDIEVVLVDFGSAELVNANRKFNRRPEASPAGTAMYMAPEVLLEGPVDSKSDIWSAGILLCLLLEGRSPFEGLSILDALSREGLARREAAASGNGKRQAALLAARSSGPHAPDIRGRKRRPPVQQLDQAAAPSQTAMASAPAGSGAQTETFPRSDASPDAVKKHLLETFKRPRWLTVSAEAKELIAQMLTVDASERPSAARIRQSAWLTSL